MTTERLRASLADRYRIERELGQGGMATVYLAHDVRHDRRVALKVLRPELAAVIGADRFLKEIKVTANLQHPHILGLIDSGEVDGLLYYVMPYVDGESLRDRLTRETQLPVDAAVRITREVASALDSAHRRGVIHRDIKPENILLHEGQALVADFGIALAVSAAGGTRMTETGMSLGTPHYMSPEQAMGEREITPRSDVYALGVVLYEMLVGEPPFTGPTAQAIVAKVVTETPRPLAPQRHTVPPHVEAAVLTALEKLPADRFPSAAEFGEALVTPGRVATTVTPGATRRVDPWRRVSAVLGVLALVLAVAAVWALRRSGGGPTVYDVGLSDSAAMALGDNQAGFAVSPRADFVVYTAQRGDTATELWYRSLIDLSSRAIPGTAGGHTPRISPDGRRLAFYQGSSIKVLPIEGGQPHVVAEVRDMSTLIWASPNRLLVLDDDGRTVRWLDADAGQISEMRIGYCIEAKWLADRQQLLCGGGAIKEARLVDPASNTSVALQATGEAHGVSATVPVAGSSFHIVDGRYLVYLSLDGDLRAATLDLASGRVGRSTTLVSGVRREAYTGAGQFALTPGGALVYVPGPNAEIGHMVEAGPAVPLRPLPIEPAAFLRFDLSPDRRRLAAAVQGVGRQELRVYDLQDGQRQVWLTALGVGQPLWSPSGDRLMVDVSDSLGWALLAGMPGSAEPPDTILAQHNSLDEVELMDYHSAHLVIGVVWARSLVLRFDPTVRPVRLDTLIQDGYFPMLSPDGRNIAYGLVSGGENLVSPYPSLDRRVQLAPGDRAGESVWLSNTEILIRSNSTWFRSRIAPGTDEVVGKSERWFSDPRFEDTPGWSQHVTQGGRLLYVQGPEQTRATYLRVVPRWVAEMEQAAREANR